MKTIRDAGYLINKFIGKDKPENVLKLIEFLFQEIFKVEGTEIDIDAEEPWENKILPKPIKNAETMKARLFSLVEILLVWAVKEIRESGFSKIKYFNLRKMMLPSFGFIRFRCGKDQNLFYFVYEGYEKILRTLISKGEYDEPYAIWTVPFQINEFTEYVVKSVCGRAPISIVINNEGKVNVVDDRTPQGMDHMWKANIRVSLYKIMSEKFHTDRYGETILKNVQLDGAEKQLLQLLREPSLEKLIVHIQKNKKIKFFELLFRPEILTIDEIEKLKKTIQYGDVEVHETEKGLSARKRITKKPIY